MNYIYLRSKSERYSVAEQEKSIKDFMYAEGYAVGPVEIEVSPPSRPLEERKEFRDFIHSLKRGDRIFIYDLRALSKRVGELVQILNCIYNHQIELVITKYGIQIDQNTPASTILALLHQQREENRSAPPRTGRPKGSISRSKYDKYREKIIQMLREDKSVSQIAKSLGVSRSSIRDYIASRELLNIVRDSTKSEPQEMPKIACKIK